MTIQMREGWVLCRGGNVDYATPNTGSWNQTHPWRLRNTFWTITNDGRWGFRDNGRGSRDIIELLDPWDARVPEEHREKRFVVGTCRWQATDIGALIYDGIMPCVYDRKTGRSEPCSTASIATAICDRQNNGGHVTCMFDVYMLTLNGKPCNPDGSPIAETPMPADEPAPAVEPETLPYGVLDPASRTTRTLRTDHYGVYAECRDGSEPVVKIVANTPPGCSVAQARALVAMILAVCEEIER